MEEVSTCRNKEKEGKEIPGQFVEDMVIIFLKEKKYCKYDNSRMCFNRITKNSIGSSSIFPRTSSPLPFYPNHTP